MVHIQSKTVREPSLFDRMLWNWLNLDTPENRKNTKPA
jgi:hypothetical protein